MIVAALLLAMGQAGGFPRRGEIDKNDSWPRAGPVIVGGGYTSLGEGPGGYRTMRLKKTNIPFNVPRALLREKAPAGNIDVTGVIETLGGKRVVQVEDFRVLPSDEQRFKELFDAAGDSPSRYY